MFFIDVTKVCIHITLQIITYFACYNMTSFYPISVHLVVFSLSFRCTSSSISIHLQRKGVVGVLRYRHLMSAPVDRTSTSACLYKQPWITYQKNKPSTSMTHVTCESKPRSVVRSGTVVASMPRKMW